MYAKCGEVPENLWWPNTARRKNSLTGHFSNQINGCESVPPIRGIKSLSFMFNVHVSSSLGRPLFALELSPMHSHSEPVLLPVATVCSWFRIESTSTWRQHWQRRQIKFGYDYSFVCVQITAFCFHFTDWQMNMWHGTKSPPIRMSQTKWKTPPSHFSPPRCRKKNGFERFSLLFFRIECECVDGMCANPLSYTFANLFVMMRCGWCCMLAYLSVRCHSSILINRS